MARPPSDEELEGLARAAEEALDAGDAEEALAVAERGAARARRAAGAWSPTFSLLQASALNQLGRSREALARADEVLAKLPEDLDAMLERGFALWELLRLDEARRQLLAVLRGDPDDAWAIHTLGLIAERRGDREEAERRFARARRLARDDFPEPVHIPPGEFDRAVEEALESLPEPVRRYLANVAIAVEDLPRDEDLLGGDPPLSPSILGVFRGAPLGQKGASDPWSHFPSSIVLYQGNLERSAATREELLEEIATTLLHEVGHFLGLDEEQLRERGLE